MRRAGLDWDVTGCDLSPVAIDQARQRARQAGVSIPFFVHDILQGRPAGDFDAVTCSLFLHHLDDEQAVELMRLLTSPDAGQTPIRLVLINDLIRSLTGLVLAHAAARLLTSSEVVHVDAPRSVRAAFTLPELRILAQRAGLSGVTVVPRWPCRFLLRWRRPS